MSSLGPRSSSYGLDSQVDNDWRLRAACRGKNPDWWEPTVGHARNLSRENRQARDMCWTACPVRVECHEAAVANPPDSVIAGGCWWRRAGTEPLHACGAGRQPAGSAR